MAYASAVALTVQTISRAGLSLTDGLVAPTATHGNKFLGTQGRTFLYVVNESVSPITVTLHANRVIDGLTLPDQDVSVAATADGDGLDFLLIGPFTPTFEQSDNYVWATFSEVADVLVGAFQL